MPGPKHFSRHLRQLNYLHKQCLRWEEEGYLPPKASLSRLRQKLKTLVMRLASHVSKSVWLRPAMCVALFLNLNVQDTFAQHFADPVTSPFGLTGLSEGVVARTVDIDDDGDLDVFTFGYDYGSYAVAGTFYENTGTPEQPGFAAPVPANIDLGGLYYFFCDFGDLDNDGDYDLYAWVYYEDNQYDQIFAFVENTGTAEVAEFANPVLDTLPSEDLLSFGFIELADIDDDGDLDLFVSSLHEEKDAYTVRLVYYENNGTPESHEFGAAVVDPFGYTLMEAEDRSFHSLGDLDEDGDIDIIGWKYTYDEYNNYYQSKFVFYENTGTPGEPQLSAPVASPFNLPDGDSSDFPCLPELADWDADGDLDLACTVTNDAGDILYFENTGTSSTPELEGPVLIELSPNPASSFLRVGMHDVTGAFAIRVYDQAGQLIYSRNELTGAHDISCKQWPSGNYILSLIQEEGQWSRQISIQH